MRRLMPLVFGLIVATAQGQTINQTQDAVLPEKAASRPTAAIQRVENLPSGDGFAVDYPGDQSIRRDPRVIFSEDFEGRNPFAEWTDRKSADNVRLTEQDPHGGFWALAIDADMQTNQGGHLFKRLRYGEDVLYVRFYVKFPSPAEYVQHFVQVSADRPARPFPSVGAGVCPDGGARFATAIEPFGAKGAWPAPGAWHLHSYWCEMAISDDGKYWGNDFEPVEPIPAVADRWTCVEVMVKSNLSPTSADGAQAFWIDGRLAAAFEGFRWRTDRKLKLNGIALLYSMTELAARSQGSAEPSQKTSILFDDVVVATSYIGPQRPLPKPIHLDVLGTKLDH